jgi:hypothetical protein
MNLDGVLSIIIGTLVLLSTLGLFKASMNVILIILSILLIVTGTHAFLKSNQITK